MILVTGGAGFIGSNFVLDWLATSNESVLNLDSLSYAGNIDNLKSLRNDARHHFVHGDIGDRELLNRLLIQYRPRAIVHFAAESHVDRSISGPSAFIKTNVEGAFTLLEAALAYWRALSDKKESSAFRFLHISTDEVYGSLSPDESAFTENSVYKPTSPYSASKAASDHFVRAWHHTYKLPVIITHCSNNYGPYQFPEKLIPLVITHALLGKALPLYGDGLNIRDWLYVTDHCAALRCVLEKARPGEIYNIGGGNELTNLEIVTIICRLLDEWRPASFGKYEQLITFVKDRPGHDRRYAIDPSKIQRELGWRPIETFESGIHKTIQWYLCHQQHELETV